MYNLEIEIEIYLDKLKLNSIKESWIIKNLPNLYQFLINKEGELISEKLYLYKFERSNCKSCGGLTKFLSYNRGYREYCSKKCSNNNVDLISKKVVNSKLNSIKKWGVDSPSKTLEVKNKTKETNSNKWGSHPSKIEEVKNKTKETNLKNWGVDNPSKCDLVKEKKKKTSNQNWGVDNPFQSVFIKDKIKISNLNKLGVDHPLKLDIIKNKIKETNLKKWGVDNFTKSKEYKELMFEKYRSSSIKTNLNTDINYYGYLGFGKHELKCDCDLDHIYQTNSHLYHDRKKISNKQCTICFPVSELSSIKENDVFNFIKSIYNNEIIKNYRDGLEIDIYIPELKIGFEFNGLYWHSELFKDKNYHLNKTNHFKEKGIRIIHIWEDDWTKKQDIIKSQIKNWLSLTENKIFARKCIIKKIDSVEEYKNFLEQNHIQGYFSSSIKLGLYYNDYLISLMTFDHFEGRKKMNDNDWNLSRFCNLLNYNVIGGASKLLKFFIKNYQPNRIISFADKSWSDGALYKKLGFEITNISYPNYSYLIDNKRSNKQKWKKSNLIKMNFDSNLSESKIMEDNFGAYKIFDCGQIKFEMTF